MHYVSLFIQFNHDPQFGSIKHLLIEKTCVRRFGVITVHVALPSIGGGDTR